MTDLPLFDWRQARDEAMARVADNAGEDFAERARSFVVRYLERHGATPGEDITDAAVAAGIVPHDPRAFGPVYLTLVRRGVIERCGWVQRRKGHGTGGGSVWRVVR